MPHPVPRCLFLLLPAMAAASPALHAQTATGVGNGRSILFVRGAERSGGFLEARDDAGHTEQLADITNEATFNGNHGWFQFAEALRSEGFQVEQITETLGPDAPATGQTAGQPVPFDELDLRRYDAIVFGSNNARYNQAQVDAVEAYIRGGGGAVFISDTNFGSDAADASDSDQPFLSRFGLRANQDRGTYAITRDIGEFLVPDHPIFAGVDAFDGEGVTPITVEGGVEDVEITVLARAEGQVMRNRPPFGNDQRGPSTPATDQDAALVVAEAGEGRVVGYFDRNTFFNDNGAGTFLENPRSRADGNPELDNRRFAINLIDFAAVPEPGTALMLGAAGLGLLARRRRG